MTVADIVSLFEISQEESEFRDEILKEAYLGVDEPRRNKP